MTKHVGETFRNQEVSIDSAEFENCRFESCRMVYSGGEVNLRYNYFDGGVTWVFDGAAANTVQFMATMYAVGGGGTQLVEEIVRNIMRREFWNRRTLTMPAVCETCYTVFDSGLNFSNVSNRYAASNTAGPCPRDDGIGRILDGGVDEVGNLNLVNGHFVGEAFAALSDMEVPAADVEKLIAAVRDVTERRAPAAGIADAIKSQATSLAPFANILAPKLAGDLYQLLAVATYVLRLKGNESIKPSTDLVNVILFDELERAAR